MHVPLMPAACAVLAGCASLMCATRGLDVEEALRNPMRVAWTSGQLLCVPLARSCTCAAVAAARFTRGASVPAAINVQLTERMLPCGANENAAAPQRSGAEQIIALATAAAPRHGMPMSRAQHGALSQCPHKAPASPPPSRRGVPIAALQL